MAVEWDDIPDEQPEQTIIDVEQGTPEWLALRAGKITGSKVADMMAEGAGITRDKYRVQLAIERMTGTPVQSGYKSAAMQKGNDDEPLARDYYSFLNDVDVEQIGFVLHPRLHNAGASPDGLIGNDGLIEIKCPNINTHIGYLLSKKIPGNYQHQINWQLACTGRQWCDFMSYRHDLPVHLRALIIRVQRDEKKIAELEQQAALFDSEVAELINQLEHLQ